MHNSQSASAATDLNTPRVRVLEGIARRVLLTARYNGQVLTLAPHALFSRRGDLFVSALNLSKNWRTDEEKRLGHFKVAGLGEVEVTHEPFQALPNSEPLLTVPGDELLLVVS